VDASLSTIVQHLRVAAKGEEQLTSEERNLLSVAYKNSVGSRRTAWRALSSIESKEESKGSKHLSLLREYKSKVEAELNKFCEDALNLLDTKLIPGSKDAPEANVFYQKMKGDYYRYIAEYAQTEAHKKAADGALAAYKAASDVANASMSVTHPLRLGLALNFSVLYYEVLNDPAKACQLAKTAFDDAIAEIESIPEDAYKDATTIMQLIRDNLTLWTTELNEDGGEDN